VAGVSRLVVLADGLAAALGVGAGIALLAEFGVGVQPAGQSALHELLAWLAFSLAVLPLVQLPVLWGTRRAPPRPLLAICALALAYLVLFALADRAGERVFLVATRAFLLVSIAFRLGQLSRVFSEARLKPALALLLGFLAVIVVGTVLFSLPRAAPEGARLDLSTAFFTAVSATCVTGLTVLDPGVDLAPFGRFVLLALIQVGGLGLMTFTTLFLLSLGGDLTLKERELLRGTLDLERPAQVKRTLAGIIGLTLVCEGVGAALLFLSWREQIPDPSERLVLALFHGVSAFCNAGFSLFSNNLARFAGHWPTYAIVSALVIIGGLGFFVIAELLRHLRRGERRRLSLSTSLAVRTSLLLLAAGTLLLFFVEREGVGAGLGAGRRAAEAFSLAVNSRTSGFNTADVSSLTNAGTILVLFLMFVGASPASTGGGIKTVTLAVFFATMRAAFRGGSAVEVSRRTLAFADVNRCLLIVALGAGLVMTSAFLLNAFEHVPFADGLFETVSAFGTVGLSRGVTAHLGDAGRLVIIATMFLGRLGPMTVGLALTARAKSGLYEYPQERVRVG
jgi:trk system potassium uptake protein TrkH